MKKIFEQLYRGEHLSFEEMAAIAETIFNGQLSEGQLGAFLVALKYNGVSVSESHAKKRGNDYERPPQFHG